MGKQIEFYAHFLSLWNLSCYLGTGGEPPSPSIP